jgi:hypothetical protein
MDEQSLIGSLTQRRGFRYHVTAEGVGRMFLQPNDGRLVRLQVRRELFNEFHRNASPLA